MSAIFTEKDTPATLDAEQLAQLTRGDTSFLVRFIAEETNFDAQRVRLLLEMGMDAAKRCATPSPQPEKDGERDSRAEFEAWAKDQACGFMLAHIVDGVYLDDPTHCAWMAWQAARSAPRAALTDATAAQAAQILEAIADEPPINGNHIAQARVLMAAGKLRALTPQDVLGGDKD